MDDDEEFHRRFLREAMGHSRAPDSPPSPGQQSSDQDVGSLLRELDGAPSRPAPKGGRRASAPVSRARSGLQEDDLLDAVLNEALGTEATGSGRQTARRRTIAGPDQSGSLSQPGFDEDFSFRRDAPDSSARKPPRPDGGPSRDASPQPGGPFGDRLARRRTSETSDFGGASVTSETSNFGAPLSTGSAFGDVPDDAQVPDLGSEPIVRRGQRRRSGDTPATRPDVEDDLFGLPTSSMGSRQTQAQTNAGTARSLPPPMSSPGNTGSRGFDESSIVGGGQESSLFEAAGPQLPVRRRLQPKPKAAASRGSTPPPPEGTDTGEVASGRGTPQPFPLRSRSPSPPPDDDDELYIPDNTDSRAAPKMAAAPPKAPAASPSLGGGDENDSLELPDFMRNRDSRPRRGEAASAFKPQLMADLGLEDSDKSNADLNRLGTGDQADTSGSAPLTEVPLKVEEKKVRRIIRPKAGSVGASPARSGAQTASPGGTPGGPSAANAGAVPGLPAASLGGGSASSGIGALAAEFNRGSGIGVPSAAVLSEPSATPRPGIPSASVPQHPGLEADGYNLAGTLGNSAVPRGLPPGAPLLAQSESGSVRLRVEQPGAGTGPSLHGASPLLQGGASPLFPAQTLERGGCGASDGEGAFSTFGADPPIAVGTGPPGGFSAFPPVGIAPSADLLSKLAFSEAKVRNLELQLEDCSQRWQQRLTDEKQQADAERERMELNCRKLEVELDRTKEMHAGDIRHLNETKQMIAQNFETEKETVRREERRKCDLELESLRQKHALEMESLQKKHERALTIEKQQTELEIEALRRSHTGEATLSRLVEQVQGSVAEVERMSKRVEGEKGLEWTMRERQLEVREKNVRDMEARLSQQTKEVEEQRRQVSELVRRMEDNQGDDRFALDKERERLEDEHKRLLALQQGVREADRNNKEALKRAWAQVEEERRSVQEERLRTDSELNTKHEELELQERQCRQEVERLKTLHSQIELAKDNASRRIRETEATVANERRALMHDLELFEKKQHVIEAERQKLTGERKTLAEDQMKFKHEVQSVGQMAAEVQKKSEDIKVLHEEATEARAEIQHLRGQLQEERSLQGNEFERLRTMQTLLEQQRLQLLETENQMRLRSIEDVDLTLMVKAHATCPAGTELGALPFGAMGGLFPSACEPQAPALPLGISTPTPEAMPMPLPGPDLMCATTPSQMAGRGRQAEAVAAALTAPPSGASTILAAATARLANRPLATPCRNRQAPLMGLASQSAAAVPAGGSGGPGGSSDRLELQTLLRRTRESAGSLQVFIQEQYQLLHQPTPGAQEGPPGLTEPASAEFSAPSFGCGPRGAGPTWLPFAAAPPRQLADGYPAIDYYGGGPPLSSSSADSLERGYGYADTLGVPPFRPLSSDEPASDSTV